MGSYDDLLPDYGELMTVEQFRSCVAIGGFTDYDGSGNPVRNGKRDRDIEIRPSRLDDIPESATHIVWFNK